jgi:hypothetical protein
VHDPGADPRLRHAGGSSAAPWKLWTPKKPGAMKNAKRFCRLELQ